MRLLVLLMFGVFLWAGSVSIQYPPQPETESASSAPPCSGQEYGDLLLDYLKIGTITQIHDNGHILTIGLSSQWDTLEFKTQQTTYETIACYAQSQNRPFQIHVNQKG